MDIDEWTSVQVETSFTLSAPTFRQLQVTCWLHVGSSTQRVQRSHQLRGQWRWSCMVDACVPTQTKYNVGPTTSQTQTNFGCVDRSRANLRCKPLTTERCKPLTSAPYRKFPGPPPRRRLHRLPRRRFHRRWRLYLLPARCPGPSTMSALPLACLPSAPARWPRAPSAA